MTSWRDGLNPDALADLDRLLDLSLGKARDALANSRKVFDPFALVADPQGKLLGTEWDTSALGPHPDVDDVLNAALVQLRGLRTQIRATALVIDTELAHPRSSAVEVRLEHRDGVSRVVLLPYKRAPFGPNLEFGELSAFPGVREVWK
jgi:hypothetical protein